MRYQVVKVRNGCWRLESEDGVVSEHSMREGAEKALLQMTGTATTKESEFDIWWNKALDESAEFISPEHRPNLMYRLGNAVQNKLASEHTALRERIENVQERIAMSPHFPGGATERKKHFQLEVIEEVLALFDSDTN